MGKAVEKVQLKVSMTVMVLRIGLLSEIERNEKLGTLKRVTVLRMVRALMMVKAVQKAQRKVQRIAMVLKMARASRIKIVLKMVKAAQRVKLLDV